MMNRIGQLWTIWISDGRAIHSRLLEIQEHPDGFSDCQETDLKGRLVDVHIYGKYAIRYWHDFNDRQLRDPTAEQRD